MSPRYNGEIERLRRRLYSETPLIGGWRRRRAAQALAAEISTATVRVLAEALIKSPDEQVRDLALQTLERLDDWRAISAVCKIWADTRHPRLTTLLLENEWVASMPPEVKVLTALKVGRMDEASGGDERFVEPLLTACEDADSIIAERARQALLRLQEEEAREALCRLVIERDDPLAREVALEVDYYPEDKQQRALFFFLTEQWERYEGLDFDQRLLRTAYAVADGAVRWNVREKLRAAGRTDFLTVIAGRDYQARVAEMTPGETDLLIQTLTANGAWSELWGLACEISFCRSTRIVETLAGAGWAPQEGESRKIFQTLVPLVTQDGGLPTRDSDLDELFPPALRRAQARVAGRINDVTFSPVRPVIAIGTGEGKVAVWNYQRGEREHLLGPFAHSVGDVTFTRDGFLLWAERTNRTDVPCAIYLWRPDGPDESPRVLGSHRGSVTAIAPVDEGRLLSAGRDGRVILWELSQRRELARLKRYFWARAMQVSPDGRHVALLHDGITLAALPGLDQLLYGSARSVGRCAAFLPSDHGEEAWTGSGSVPDNRTLLMGQYSGNVVKYYPRNERWITYEVPSFTYHEGRVEGVNFLSSRSVVVTAGSEGTIRFIDLDDRSTIGEVEEPRGQVTSLHVSSDESFMAVGNSRASFSLWDLRYLDVLNLLLEPLARAPTSALTILGAVMEGDGLSPRARRTLEFAQQMLRHRVRFDIELGPAPSLVAGEFDIEIE